MNGATTIKRHTDNGRGPHEDPTEANRDALARHLDGGLTLIEIAKELGWSRNKVYRVADKTGLSVRGRPHRHVRKGVRSVPWRGPWEALTEADRDALVPYLDSSLHVRDIARELGWTFTRVYRVADKFGIPVRARHLPAVKDVEAAVADMRPLEAVEWLIEAYRNLSGESPPREAQLVADYRMPPAAAKLYAVLEAAKGSVVTHEALETIFDQAGYEGSDMRRAVRVHATHLRRHLERLGWPVRVEAVYCAGYLLVDSSKPPSRGR